MNRTWSTSIVAWGLFSIGLLLHSPVQANTVAHLEVTRGAVNSDGQYQAILDRLLAQDGLLKMGRYQAIGEIVPSIDKACETYSLFTSGFSGAEAPSALISGSTITADLSSLFFSAGRGNSYRSWNIGEVATGLFNPDTKEFSLAWDRVLDGDKQPGQASFFLSGLVHFDAQPVPIPAAGWLFGSGLAGVAALMRRRTS